MQDTDTPISHLICFYINDQSFLQTLTTFSSQILNNPDEALIVFATEPHQNTFKDHDQLIIFDASKILAEFMEGDLPNAEKFNAAMSRIIANVPAQYSKIHIYSEIVNLLWEKGNFPAAIALEKLYTDFAATKSVSLLCGHAKVSHELCALHTQVIPDEEYMGSAAQLRNLSTYRENFLALKTAQEREKNLWHSISELSHEIRNYLHGASGNAELLSDDMRQLELLMKQSTSLTSPMEPVLETIQERLNAITTSINQQAEVLNSNLNRSKLAAGKLELERYRVNLKDILREIEIVFKSMAYKKGLAFRLFLPEEEITIKGDATRIKQIITNLLTNSLKFTEKGHICVKLELQEKTLTRTNIVISVEDTGIGLSEDEIQNIGTRFTQANAEVRQKFGGWGVGLFLSIGLTKEMKGDLSIESKKGVGSIFRCTFSFDNSMSPDLTIKKSEAHASILLQEKAEILIVDDNVISRKILENYLSPYYKCHFAENGTEALEKHLAIKPKLILMDIKMDGMDGLTAIRKIREKDKTVPILTISADILDTESQIDITDCLTKPFKKEDVLGKVASCLYSSISLLNDHTRKGPPI